MATTKTIVSDTSVHSFTVASGKQIAMTSFNKYLVGNVGGGEVHDGLAAALSTGKLFWWLFGYPLSALMFPSISVVEVGLFSPDETALGRIIGMDRNTGLPIKGSRNQTLIEINCWAKDTAERSDAEKVVRDLRDRVMYVLQNAGEWDEKNDELLFPSIALRDYSKDNPPKIGFIRLDRRANSVTERFIVDPVDQNIKRYRLLVRVFWDELT